MRLHELHIKGFKSFPDKAVLRFDAEVTGIVGPNGCGKSNIVDAIRWVLGEQKIKHLRADKMENVIFNGTKTRRAQHLAEVSLVLDNHKHILPRAYKQVTLARRLYRDGESEYAINGVLARRKDMISLLLDSGLSPEVYSIIELKRVEDVIGNAQHARNILFEQAAGLARFKLRKKEVQQRLAAAEHDLARLDDLIQEMARNLKQLEKQSKEAQKYRLLRDEYKQIQGYIAQKHIAILDEKLSHLNDEAQKIKPKSPIVLLKKIQQTPK